MSKFKTIFLLLAFTLLANFSVVAQSPGGDPPAPFAVTGTGSYCTGGTGVAVGLAGSETGVTYTLYKGTDAQTPTVDGTGSAISFGNQLIGSYTVKGTSQLGTTDMTGTATITLKPAFAISSQSTDAQTITYGGAFTSISVTATGSGLTYQWYSHSSASTTGGTPLEATNGAQTDTYTPQATTAGTTYYYCVVTGDCGVLTSDISGAFIVNQKTQTISFSALDPKTYGDAYFTVSATGGTSGNPVTFTSSNDNIVTCTGTNGTTITIIGAGDCTIYANQAGNTNYSAASQVSQALTINKKALTITGTTAADKVYDGSATATLSGSTLSGIVGSDDVSLTGGTATFADKNVGDPKTVTVTGYSLTGSKVDNYTLSAQPSGITAKITARPITITADVLTKTYGDSDPTLTAQITSGAIQGSDAASGSLTRTVGESVSAYAIAQGTYTYGSNYNETFVSKDLTITKRAITITADSKSKTYGDADPGLTAQVTSGAIQGSDAASGSLSRDAGETVGVYAINKGTYTYGSNYDETYVSKDLTINKRDITITADAKSKTYGDTDPALTAQITTGSIKVGDVASGSLARVTGETVGIYAINQGTYTYGSNYNETYVGKDLTVNKRDITITADAKSKTYGDADPTLTAQVTTGVIQGSDVVSGSLTRAAGESVGTYAITKGTYTYGSNYNETYASKDLTIDKLAITITADIKTKTYGDADPTLTAQVTSGSIKSGDVASGSLTRDTGESVANYAITKGSYTYGSNYNETYVSKDLTIEKRAITITADANTKTYGDADPTLTVQVTSGAIQGSDVASGSLTRAAGELVGAYAINKGTYTYGSNYNETYVSKDLTIGKRAITITADVKSKTYGDTDPALTAQVTTGTIKIGDVASGSLVRATGETVGTYAINQSTYTYGSNYDETYVSKDFTISKRPITITANIKTKTYGDADPTFTAQVTSGSIVTGDVASGSLTRDAGESVGTYAITQGTYTYGSNYNETYVSKNLTIGSHIVTVTAVDKTKEYDGTVYSPFTVTYSGFISGDNESTLGGTLSFSGSASTAKDAGTGYVITPGGLTSTNYTLVFVDGRLDITKKTLTIAAEDKTKEYDGAVYNTFTSTYSGFAVGDNESSLTGTLSYSGSAIAAKNGGAGYTIIPAGLSSPNYLISFVGGKLDITKKALTITAEDKTKVYDGAVYSPFTVTYNGFASGDDASNLAGTIEYNGTAKAAIDAGTNYTITPSGQTTTNYDISYINGKLDITKKAQSITFANLANKTYNDPDFNLTATASSDLPVSYSSSNIAVATISGNTVTIKGVGSTIITASQSGNINYTAATDVTQTLTVGKANQVLTLSPLPVGSLPLKDFTTAIQVTASSSAGLAVTISLGSGSAATLNGSNQLESIQQTGTVTVDLTQAGNDNYNAASNSYTFDVVKTNQTITFNALSDIAYTPGLTVDLAGKATTNSPLAISYTVVSGPATILGTELSITGAGAIVIKASQAGNAAWNPATDATQTLTIGKATPSITNFDKINKIYNDPSFTLNATSASTGSFTYSSSNTAVATIVGNTVTIVGTGTTTLTASQAFDGNYTTASTTATLEVGLNTQSISFGALATKTYGDLPYSISAVGGASSKPVVFSSSDNNIATCTGTNGSTITIIAAGSCTISANQSGDANYSEASKVDQLLTINKKELVISGVTVPNKIYDGSATATLNGATLTGKVGSDDVTLTGGTGIFDNKNFGTAKAVTASGFALAGAKKDNYVLSVQPSGLSADITVKPLAITGVAAANKPYDATSAATLTGVTLTGVVGTEDVTLTGGTAVFADISVGNTKGVTVTGYTLNGSDKGNYILNAQPSGLSADITARVITITADVKSKTYGDTDPALTAQITSGAIQGSDVASGSLNRAIGETVGTYAINKGTYTFGDNYAETFVSKDLTIDKRAITITADAKSKTYGDADPALTAQVTSGTIQGSDGASGSLTRATGETAGAYAINQGTYTYGGNYTETFASADLTIAKRSQTITFNALASKTYVDPDFDLTATASSGLPVTYTSSNTAVATIAGSTVKIVGVGSTNITAKQEGDANYTAATDVIQNLTVTNIPPSNLVYTTPVVYVTGKAITSMTPTVQGGYVTNYVVNPTLPAGLNLDATTGIISGTPTSTSVASNYVVTASNTDGNTTFTVSITVNDPTIKTGVAPANLTYATPLVFVAGKAVTPLTPSISGGAATNYSVSPSLPAGLSISNTTGVISGTPSAITSESTYLVTASNADGSTTFPMTITINDPTITTEVGPSNLAYTTPLVCVTGKAIIALSPSISGGTATNYSVSPSLPNGLNIDNVSGVISGTPTSVTPESSYQIIASNNKGNTAYAISITINDPAITTGVAPANLSYATPAVYAVGTAIAPLTSTVEGGAVTSYSVSPALPSGLSLNSTSGTITGTPTALTTGYVYQITATNIYGSTSFDITLTVNAAGGTTGIAPSNLSYASPAVYAVGSAITGLTPTVSGSVTSYAVSPALPTGLTINTTSGVISGTPSAITAAADYTITATNATGSTSDIISITVNATGGATGVAPSDLKYATPVVYSTGSSVILTPTVTGTVDSYSVNTTLPAGLTLNATSGSISGTPTAAKTATNYLVTASNAIGSTDFPVNITINDPAITTGVAPSNLSYATPAVYAVGTAIAPLTSTVEGGAVTSYSVSPALPSGLSLNTTSGTITGTPTALTTGSVYQITATNIYGSTNFDISITVNAAGGTTGVAPSKLSYASPAVYAVGGAITGLTPTVSGSVTSYAVSPALPTGLILNTTSGIISGTPSAITAAADYTITATNATGSTSDIISITVNATGGATGVAPSDLKYATPVVYGTGSSVILTPTVTGIVDSYSVNTTLPAGLTLNASTGVISGTPTAAKTATNYLVTASNAIGSTDFPVNITINDAAITTGVAPSNLSYASPAVYAVGTAIAPLTSTVEGGAVTSYSVSPALPSGLSLNTTSGIITGTPTTLTTGSVYQITATNIYGSTNFDISITVNAAGTTTGVAPSKLSYASPAVYAVGTTISELTPTVSGSVTSYSVSPALPAGLTLNSVTGTISGTPTAVSVASNYTITATNAIGSTSDIISITVNATGGVTGVAPSDLKYATPVVYVTGKAIAAMTPTVTGTVDSYSVNTTLPAGLTLNASTGVISGTPTAAKTATNYLVTASNATGSTDFTVNITINDAAITTGVAPANLSYASPAVYAVGTAIAPLTSTVKGGAVNSYSVSPALPSGLSLNTTSGTISGTPTAVTPVSTYQITAMNIYGSTNFDISITVNAAGGTTGVAPSNLSYASPAVYAVGTAITGLTPTVSGSVTSYAVSPALPAGLTLNATSGIISGTPTAVSSIANYTIIATNATGSTSTMINITVNATGGATGVAPSDLKYATPVVYGTGSSVILTPTVTGIVDSYSVNTTLPAGLTLNASTGVISGTPTAAMTATNYLVTASNAIGSTDFPVNITINDAAITTGVAPSNLSYASPAVYAVGTAIAPLTSTVEGGAVTSYSVSPALPSGLSLNTTSGTITGAPTTVSTSKNYSVTASNGTGSTNFDISITVNAAGGTTGVAPSKLSYASPAVYAAGTAITGLTPTVSGSVTSYAVSPALPTGLILNTTSGIISGTPSAITAAADYTITATNATGSTSDIISITVNATGGATGVAPSDLKYATPVVYVTGKAIAAMSPSVTGTVDSYSVNTALPAGLTLNATSGIISGTPTAVMTATNYLVTASNATGSTDFTVNITINDPAITTGVAPSNLSYASPAVYAVGTAITPLTSTVSGGSVSSYSISPALPNGLTLNNVTGTISGTPTVATPVSVYQITATNSNGSTSFDISITVNAAGGTTGVAPSKLNYASPVVYAVGTTITGLTPTVSGSVTSYAVSPALPAGLTLNPVTGTISGTPTAVSTVADYTVTASNAIGNTTATISITVNATGGATGVAPSDLKYATPVVYGIGSSVILTPTVTGTVDSYSVNTTLPAGLTLNATSGSISGTPTAASAATNYLVTATNATGSTSFTVNITINEKSPIAGDTNGNGKIDGTEIAGDKDGDGKITSPEITGDKDGDGKITSPEIAGDKDGDGKITSPEMLGDTNGDGKIDNGEIAGDANGDGKIGSGETAGNTGTTGSGIAGDTNGDGKITSPEIAGDTNGDGKIDGPEIAGDKDGDGKITTSEITGDTNGDGKIDGTEIAGDTNADGKVNTPEITGDINGDGKIDGTEIAGDSNGDGQITPSDTPTIVLDPINNTIPIEGCENTSIEFEYSILKGSPTQYKLTFGASAIAVGIKNVDYTNLPTSANTGTLSFAIPNAIQDGIYKGVLTLRDQNGIESAGLEFQFIVNVSSNYIIKKFDDVVLCDNSNNRFTAYQWYKDGVAIQGATNQFYCDPTGLVGIYSVELTTVDGQKIKTCQKEFNTPVTKSVKAYPNPVSVNQECTIETSGFENEELETSKLVVYDLSGNRVYNSDVVNKTNSVKLPPIPGTYVGRINTNNGKGYEFKVIIKK